LIGKYQNRFQRGIPDIFHILMFYWYEPILYVDTVSKFPETIEKPGYSVCFEDNVGDALTFEILKNDLNYSVK
jgi:hypothetical protein